MGTFPNPETYFKTTDNRAVISGRKGGQQKSVKKNLAAQISALKRWGITKGCLEKVDMLFLSPELSAKDIYKHIHKIEEFADPNDKNTTKFLLDYKERWHRLVHSDKTTPHINIQINNIMDDKKEEIINRLLKEVDDEDNTKTINTDYEEGG